MHLEFLLINVGARTLEIDSRISGFFLRDAGEKVCVVGFSKQRMNLHRYEIERCLFAGAYPVIITWGWVVSEIYYCDDFLVLCMDPLSLG